MRLVVFADSSSIITNILVENLLHYVIKNGLLERENILVVDTYEMPYKKLLRRVISYLVKCIFCSEYSFKYEYVKLLSKNVYTICKNFNVKIIHVRNINESDFISMIEGLKPLMGLALGCPQIFKKEVIEKFDILVNYHNSLLPKYRGLCATSWSIYMGEKRTGFSFHIVNENIDDGNILISDAIDITDESVFELEIYKTHLAAKVIPKLLKLMLNNDKGSPQTGTKSYFGKKDLENIITINNIEELTYSEILKRIRSFGLLKIKKDQEIIHITKIKAVNKNSEFDFITKDGIPVKIIRYSCLPKSIYNIYKLIKRFRSCNDK